MKCLHDALLSTPTLPLSPRESRLSITLVKVAPECTRRLVDAAAAAATTRRIWAVHSSNIEVCLLAILLLSRTLPEAMIKAFFSEMNLLLVRLPRSA